MKPSYCSGRNSTSWFVRLLNGDGRARACSSTLVSLWLLAAALPAHAVNNDGKTDIYWRNYSTGDNSAWTMNGVSYVSSVTMAWQGDTSWQIVGTGDFNNDGELDLLWRNSATGFNVIWFLSGGGYRSSAWLQPLTDTNWTVAGTGYFSGVPDKFVDILWRNTLTGDNAVWHMNGATLVSAELIQEVPDLNWKIGGTGDFNGDGHTDIVWRHATTGLNYFWYMQGAALITTAQIQAESDTNWEIVGAGYFSSATDTSVDLLWRHKTYGDNAIWQMSGASFVSSHTLPWVSLQWKVGGTGDSKCNNDPSVSDGLPDIWERRFFGILGETNSGDSDGDGQNNLTEYQNGSDPTSSNTLPTLGNAVEANLLTWTSGGNSSWVHFTGDYVTGGDCAKSGGIGDNQISWMEIKLIGPGTLSFYWKVSSSSGDYFRFTRTYPDGSGGGWGQSGSTAWQQYSISFGAGTNTFRFEYSKDSSGSGGNDSAYVDNVQVTYSTNDNNATNSLAEAVDDFGRDYITGTWSPWSRVTTPAYYGGDSAQSWNISDGGQTSMFTALTGPGTVSFYWKVSSEPGYDELKFYINSALQSAISGDIDWEQRSFSVPSGSVQLEWRYKKDESEAWWSDRGWVDRVQFIPDYDNDGLPDPWETQHFGSITSQNGTGDYDADGYNNLQEYLNGTNPTLAELRVRIASPRKGSLLP